MEYYELELDFSKSDEVLNLERIERIKKRTIQEWAIEFEMHLQKSIAGEAYLLNRFKKESEPKKVKDLSSEDIKEERKNHLKHLEKHFIRVASNYEGSFRVFIKHFNRMNLFTSMDLFETKEFRAAKKEFDIVITRAKNQIEKINRGEKVDLQPPNQNYPNTIPQKTAWLGNMQELSALLKALKGQKKIGENVWVFMGEHFTKEDGKEINTDQARKDFPKISDSTSKKMNTLVKDVLKNDQNNSGT